VSSIDAGYAIRVRWFVHATCLVAPLLAATPSIADDGKKADSGSTANAAAAAGINGSVATAELYHSVKTKKPRAALSQFLVKTADKAVKDRAWSKAIPLYQALVAARGPASPEAKQLATLWTLAGQNEDAAEAWLAYGHAVTNETAKAEALAEAERLQASPDPFAEKLALAEMKKEATQAFTLGRAAFKAGQFGDALVLFHMGYALAPDLPGFLRELGSTYDKLGETARKRDFYRRYLISRPFGPNADVVRSELARDKDVLGTLTISSSLPCAQLWVNRQRITGKLPEKGILVAPGTYKGLCFHPKYEMAHFEDVKVEPGVPARMSFRWAIVVNKLERPFGRIALENAKSPGVMIDLGITSSEVGVPVPADGGKLRMVLKDDSGVRTDERSVQIEPGQKLVVQW
jgi:tetratricopeptide (TPR) repeat protein